MEVGIADGKGLFSVSYANLSLPLSAIVDEEQQRKL